jgi:hypothetical protein
LLDAIQGLQSISRTTVFAFSFLADEEGANLERTAAERRPCYFRFSAERTVRFHVYLFFLWFFLLKKNQKKKI